MRPVNLKFAALAAACALAMAGCATSDTRDEMAGEAEPTPVSEPDIVREQAPKAARPIPADPLSSAAEESVEEIVGVQACDDFLSTYKACHTVISAYDPVTLERRYDEMRTALLRQARDPAIAPDLEARCAGLATQRDEALRGRACVAADPIVDSSDDD